MRIVDSIFVALSSTLALVGCSSANGADSDVKVSTNKQLTDANSSSGYFVVTRRDVRRCASPQCGGWFVKRVNEATTQCADGTLQEECYVSSIELGNLGLSQGERDQALTAISTGKGLVQANLTASSFGTLEASHAWVAATGSSPSGTFYVVADNGTRCITTPCPSLTARPLNGGEMHNVIDVVLDRTQNPASPESIDRASEALATQDGLLVAGSLLLPKCVPNTNCGPKVIASEFYLPVTTAAPVTNPVTNGDPVTNGEPATDREGKACGGLAGLPCGPGQFCFWKAGDLCGAADAPGRCIVPPQNCTTNVDPVCGCDGQTYSNACVAASNKASVLHKGSCP